MTHTEALKLARDCIRDSVEYKQGKATAIEAVEDIDEALAQPLTDEEHDKLMRGRSTLNYGRAVETAHGITAATQLKE